jgi:hypothetical protein
VFICVYLWPILFWSFPAASGLKQAAPMPRITNFAKLKVDPALRFPGFSISYELPGEAMFPLTNLPRRSKKMG